MKQKIIEYGDLMKNILGTFRKEVYDCLGEHPDVFTDAYREMFHVDVVPSAVIFIEDELLPMEKKSFSRKMIINTYNDGLLMRTTTPCCAHMGCKEVDGKLKIVRLFIKVNYDIMVLDVLKHLPDLSLWVDAVLKTHARHEAGHILDYILSFDGKKPEVLKKNKEESRKAKDEWLTWWKTISEDGRKALPKEQEKERLTKYFNLPDEISADTLGTVDRAKAIDYMVNSSDKCIDVVIKTKERPNKEDNK